MIPKEDLHALASELAIALGLLALGIATASHLWLMTVQGVVMTTPYVPLEAQAGELYPVLVYMQTVANGSGLTAAALLVGGGYLATRTGHAGGDTDA